jgi:hypothetical protein
MRRTTVVGLSAVLLIGLLFAWSRTPALKTTPPVMPASVFGTVVDEASDPLAAARVRWKGQHEFVHTDASGRFTLPPSSSPLAIITAAKPGYFIKGVRLQDELRLMLVAFEKPDNPDYVWVDPRPDQTQEHNCANCHAEIYAEWKASGHARSASGEHLLQLYASAHSGTRAAFDWSLVDDYPEGLGVCASCHAPSVDPLNPKQHDLRELSGVASQGVHCDFCHKIEDASDERAGLAHGVFGLKLRRPHEGQLFFGPLDDVDRGEDAFAPVHQESRVCASCHEGTLFGVPVYSTYSEWLESPARQAGQQCQTCHMTPTKHFVNVAPGFGGIERDASTLASHGMLPSGIKAMLQASLKMEATAKRQGDGAIVSVTVKASNVGHRMPTGYIDRHLILIVEAVDAEGQVVAAVDGPKLPAAVGAAWQNASGQIFGRMLRAPDGQSPAPFWKAGVSMADTRLAPEQPETFTFSFPQAARSVRVRLVYRRFWQQVTEAKQWEDDTLTITDQTVKLSP